MTIPNYEIVRESNLTKIKIINGQFKDLEFSIDDFKEVKGKLSYNYRILSGDVFIEDGISFKLIMESIINDIINEHSMK